MNSCNRLERKSDDHLDSKTFAMEEEQIILIIENLIHF